MNKTFYEKLAQGNEHEFKKLDEMLPEPFTYKDFVRSPFVYRSHDPTVQEAMYQVYCFHRYEGRVYEIRDSIADLLMHTNLDISTDLFNAPFRQIILSLPPDWLKVRDLDTPKLMDLTECYVNYEAPSNGPKKLRVMFVGKYGIEEGMIIGRINLEGSNLKDAVDKAVTNTPVSALQGHEVRIDREDRDNWRAYFQFICNAILYITSADADVRKANEHSRAPLEERLKGLKSASKIRKLQSRVNKISVLTPYVVGASVTLSDEERDMYAKLREETINGRHHGYRYPVGGHWRDQWYGSKQAGNLKQKMKWIRPHLRGPEISEVLRTVGILK